MEEIQKKVRRGWIKGEQTLTGFRAQGQGHARAAMHASKPAAKLAD